MASDEQARQESSSFTAAKIRELGATQNQARRLTAERDLLLSAIAPEDYAKIQAQMVAISESPDEPEVNDGER